MEREAIRKRRTFSPVMTALLAVLVMAGCILTLLVVQFRKNMARQQAQQAKDESIARQLEEIRQYLSAVDETLLDGQVTDADGYDSLFREVSTMQQNLTDFKENNVIADDAIGQNLDDVIEQLSVIQTNLEEERRVSESLRADVDASETTAAAAREENRKNAEQLQQTVDVQLSDVREDIRKLIRDASGESREEYRELLSVLNGADSDLESLEKTVAANHDRIQSVLSSGIGSINGSVSSLHTALTAMEEKLNAIREQYAGLQSQWGTIAEQQADLKNTLTEEQRNLFSSAEERQNRLEELLQSQLDGVREQIREAQSGPKEELLAGQEQLQQLLREYGERFDAQEKLLEEQGEMLRRMQEMQKAEADKETPDSSGDGADSRTEESGEEDSGEPESAF